MINDSRLRRGFGGQARSMSVRAWFERARSEGFAIGSFNVANLETIKAVVETAAEMRSPILLESSPGETKWVGANTMVAIAHTLSKEHGIPVFVNLDHAEKLEHCMTAIEAGYDLIHFDGSHGDLDENIRITKEVVKAAHAKNLLVEAEIDALPTKSSEIYKDKIPDEVIKKSYSDPEKVKAFAEETGVDTMATVFGNVHGILLQQEEVLDFDLVARIRAANPDIFLSMHGSSGIPEVNVTRAIQVGKIVKVNISTEIRKAYRETLERVLKENPDQLAVYKFMPPVIEAIKAVARRKIEAYGSAGKA